MRLALWLSRAPLNQVRAVRAGRIQHAKYDSAQTRRPGDCQADARHSSYRSLETISLISSVSLSPSLDSVSAAQSTGMCCALTRSA